ncbi:MAG: tyrosine-type recombinase/integrase [Erysipelotrichaceae bacterium]|nr:tyrosine-type recombinase/integrase [Erysipelotrichaceae bacterium]
MATVKQRKNSYSVIYSYKNENGERKQKWEKFHSNKEANKRKTFIEYYQSEHGLVLVPLKEQHANEIKDAQSKKEDSDNSITFGEFLDIFVNLYGTNKWSVSTYTAKKGEIENYIKPYIGDVKLKDITTKMLTEYYNQLLSVPQVPNDFAGSTGKLVQPAGVKKIHDIIRCALNQAIRWEYLDQSKRNPATLVTLPKMQKNPRAVWSIETFRQAVTVADDDLLIICMHLAFSCSMRMGEILGLTWDDVVIDETAIATNNARVIINKELTRLNYENIQKLNEKEIIRIFPSHQPHAVSRLVLKTPKTETSNRTVWLPKTVARLLVEYKHNQDELKEFLGDIYTDYNLVTAQDNGDPTDGRIVRKRFKALCVNNGFECVVFHSLRHLSTGYKLKLTNGDVKSVQGDTGHAEAEMVTDVYSRIIDEDRRYNAQKMDQEFYSTLDVDNEAAAKKTEDDAVLLELLKSMSEEEKQKLIKKLKKGK